MKKIEFKYDKENDRYICPYCGKGYSKHGIHTHVWRMHTKEGQEFIPQSSGAWNKGKTKETDERIAKASEKLKEGYESGRLKGSFTGKHHTKEAKEKISKKAKGNLKAIRFKRENVTIQEQRIMDILEEHHIEFKHNYPNYIKEGKTFHNYIYDLAIVDLLINIECDGWQHTLENRVKNDELRDKLSVKYGWNVLRFTNKQIDTAPDYELWNIIKKFIDDSKNTIEERKCMYSTNPYLEWKQKKEIEEEKRKERDSLRKELGITTHPTLDHLKK